MKIGIVTCHRAHNYGAVLQAYALKHYLIQLGHDVEFADFVPTYFKPIKEVYRRSFWKSSLKQKLLYPKYLYKWWWPAYKLKNARYNRFDSFIKQYIIPKPLDYRLQQFDMAIYGSDQIWSKEPLDNGTTYFDSAYWGDDTITANTKVTYSASMGVLCITPEDHDSIKSSLKQFVSVAVREQELYDYLLQNDLIEADKLFLTIDPVFLLDKKEWEKLVPKRIVDTPYLLFYDFQIDPDTTKMVKQIADEKKLKIVRLTDGIVNTDKIDGYMPTAGPLAFLSLIYYADFVVSSSFHGTAFSIIFEKQFVARQVWNTSRVKSLLKKLDIDDRFVHQIESYKNLGMINYQNTQTRLESLILDSKKYLQLRNA